MEIKEYDLKQESGMSVCWSWGLRGEERQWYVREDGYSERTRFYVQGTCACVHSRKCMLTYLY